MTTNNFIFSFDDLSNKDKAVKAAMKYFSRAGHNAIASDVDPKIKRTSGISYREMTLTFGDSQKVKFRIKQTGDIYQVLLNDKLIPIKNQDDHVQAIAEIVARMSAGASAFQKKLAKANAALPKAIKTAAPKMMQVLTEKRDNLKAAIAAIDEELAALQQA